MSFTSTQRALETGPCFHTSLHYDATQPPLAGCFLKGLLFRPLGCRSRGRLMRVPAWRPRSSVFAWRLCLAIEHEVRSAPQPYDEQSWYRHKGNKNHGHLTLLSRLQNNWHL